ncbi:hypothetical protein NC652_025804 [Populus alba x Populus x berolinensis]|nr:hypothetical protein NC652_025804 [Populus alba x Populus x berolinensis]
MGFMEYAKSIQWEHESYPAYEDYIVLPLFSLFFTFVRFFLDRFVFQKLATTLDFWERSIRHAGCSSRQMREGRR